MRHFNQIIIRGELHSHDDENHPLVRYMDGNGDAVCNFNVLQTNYDWKTGEPKTNDDGKVSKKWHRCTAWRDDAELVGRLACGESITVVGKVVTRYNEQKKEYRDEVTVSRVFPAVETVSGFPNTPAQFPDTSEIINLDDDESYV